MFRHVAEDLESEQVTNLKSQPSVSQEIAVAIASGKTAGQSQTPTSTTESLSTYAERTMKTICEREGTIILSQSNAGMQSAVLPESSAEKRSESEQLRRNPTEVQKNERPTGPTQVNSQVSVDDSPSVVSVRPVKDPIDPKLYFTDTSDIVDSSGVGGPTTPQAKSTPTSIDPPSQDADSQSDTDTFGDQA